MTINLEIRGRTVPSRIVRLAPPVLLAGHIEDVSEVRVARGLPDKDKERDTRFV